MLYFSNAKFGIETFLDPRNRIYTKIELFQKYRKNLSRHYFTKSR